MSYMVMCKAEEAPGSRLLSQLVVVGGHQLAVPGQHGSQFSLLFSLFRYLFCFIFLYVLLWILLCLHQ